MMKNILVTTVLLGILSTPVFSQNLLFKSGFEDTVKLSKPIASGGQWYQYFTGTDLTSGYQWPDDLPTQTKTDAYWTFKVPDTVTLSDYAEVKIDTTESYGGDRSLYMAVTDYDSGNFGNSMPGWVRCEYRLNIDTTLQQGYISYWMKMQSDLYDIMPFGSGRWRIIMEWFETGPGYPDYRWGVSPRTGKWANDSTSVFWSVYKDSTDSTNQFVGDTSMYQQQYIQPGEWFQLQVYWKQASDSSGRIWVGMDGNTLIDFRGPNRLNSRIQNWQIFKLYVDPASMDDGVVYQWIDEVEVWDSIPQQASGGFAQNNQGFSKISVAPNPSKSVLKIKWEKREARAPVQLLLYDVRGQKIYERSNIVTHPVTIQTDQLESGLYFFQMRDAQNKLIGVQKIIIE